MEKQIITKKDIQQLLLAKLNKRKAISIFLTIIIIIGIALYPIHLINYLNGTSFDYEGGYRTPPLPPTIAVFIVIPLTILLLIFAVAHLYYIDLYKIKMGKFEITEETLYQKEKELIHYYKNARKENSLYFRCGRIAVEDEVYSYSKIEDRFYLVVLKSKKAPQLAFHTEHYEIEKS